MICNADFFSYFAQMKGKMKLSNFEGLTPMKEECSSKTTAKIKFLNTYRLEPYNKFQDQLVRDKAQAILTKISIKMSCKGLPG